MFTEKLDHALNNTNPDTDKTAWLRFCEWAHSFHDIDINQLTRYGNFAVFEKNEFDLPLKYLEAIKDLWIKWSKAVAADRLANI